MRTPRTKLPDTREAAEPTVLLLGALASASMPELEAGGFTTTLSEDAQGAQSALEQQAYSLLLCDLECAGPDHLKFVSEISRQYPDMGVVAMIRPEDLLQGMMAMIAGAAGYVQAPCEADLLVATLKNATKRKRVEVFLMKGRPTATRNPNGPIAA